MHGPMNIKEKRVTSLIVTPCIVIHQSVVIVPLRLSQHCPNTGGKTFVTPRFKLSTCICEWMMMIIL